MTKGLNIRQTDIFSATCHQNIFIFQLTLLFPFYDKLHRLTGDHWRLFATTSSAAGTALTVAVLARGLEVISILDELVVPVLVVFTTTVEVVGFVFIYGKSLFHKMNVVLKWLLSLPTSHF